MSQTHRGLALLIAGTVLLVDGRRTDGAYHVILRPGRARTSDRADDLAVLHQRDAAARGDHVIERYDVFGVAKLDGVLEGLGRPAEFYRGARLVLGNGDGAD